MIHQYDYQSEVTDNHFHVTIGKVAQQANGECLIQAGETTVLVTAVMADEPREGQDFFPLTCNYEEKLYAVGRIPGGYIKREGKGTDEATLNSRGMDRPMRPLFPEGFFNEVQVIATVLSVDGVNPPQIAAMNGASLSTTISDIPFDGPVGAVIVGYIDGQYVINPSEEALEHSELNLTVAATEKAIVMVEAGANELPEELMLGGIMYGFRECQSICRFFQSIQKEIGKEKYSFELHTPDAELQNEVRRYATGKVHDILYSHILKKGERDGQLSAARKDTLDHFMEADPDHFEDNRKDINAIFDQVLDEVLRRMIAVDKDRPDGRKLDEIRPLSAEVGLIPRVHGSGLFSRGETQVLSLVTLGGPQDVQYIDGLHQDEVVKHYFHQYNFPPFCVGDIKPLRSPNRREVGHGHLAERALLPVLPDLEDFPYTIRVVSEVLSSNGSSSQASICGSTLSLMDAGVPIKAPVAGIAMGLVADGDDISILTDIQGMEDHLGDMDFKVAGTSQGVTALQMDIKIEGISEAVLKQALQQAKTARLQILQVIKQAIPEPRKELSPHAPRILAIDIDPSKIGRVIGKNGSTINQIVELTGSKIDTEDDGHITITADTQEGGETALRMIQEIVHDPEVGDIYEGPVVRILKFGAFVDLGGGKDGMIHISKLADRRVERVEDVINIGDQVRVKIIQIDEADRIDLSLMTIIERGEGSPKKEEGRKNHRMNRNRDRERSYRRRDD